jgi:hypothetical protein
VPSAIREPGDLADLAQLFAFIGLDRSAGIDKNLLEL